MLRNPDRVTPNMLPPTIRPLILNQVLSVAVALTDHSIQLQ